MQHEDHSDHCHPKKGRPDFILWGSLGAIVLACFYRIIYFNFGHLDKESPPLFWEFSHTVVNLLLKMSFGLIFALVVVGIMGLVPRAKFHQVLGTERGLNGILRATLAGVVLDLCSHGILLVGMKLYERGVSLGQVIAFLVASPWNSFSMTLILWSLIGLKLTIAFIVISACIAVITGLAFDFLVSEKKLPPNPNRFLEAVEPASPWIVWPEGYRGWALVKKLWIDSLHESKVILRWIFFGIILTALVKELMNPEVFQFYFGPDVRGVILTLVAATVIEVCSEGSAPLASELANTAGAPGNAFSFLMAGVSTDYTEIMALKETTKSWRVAFFLPFITLPQIIFIGALLNWAAR